MMLANVFAKAVRDRATGLLVGTLSVALMLLGGMAVYANIDTSFYYELPEAFLESFGISAAIGGVGGIAYGAIFNFMGAMTVASLAISIGSGAVAGEERDGTLGLLLANPCSRTSVVASKMASLVALLAVSGAILWVGGRLTPVVLDVDVGGVAVGGQVTHLTFNALLWGMLALALGAWTGNRTVASGVAVGAMVLSWLAVSFLPLVDRVSGLARVFPWYYFSGSQPEVNGLHWGHLAVLSGLVVLLAVVALVGVNRRDLRESATSQTLLDRLRTFPPTRRVAERIAGSARVSGITAKTVSEHQGMAVVIAGVLLYSGLLIAPLYNVLPEAFTDAMRDLPEALIAAIGGVDMSTPTGWIQGEIFSALVPIALITMLAVVGARGLAGEERSNTMGLLLANPVSRGRVVLAKATAMVVWAAVLGVATFVAVAAGVVVGRLDVSIAGVAAASVLATLVSLVFGGVALALSAATGKVSTSAYGTAGVALAAYFIDSFVPLAEGAERWDVVSPFHYFLGSNPLDNGMHWGHAAILVALFGVLVGLSVPAFQRRDLRS